MGPVCLERYCFSHDLHGGAPKIDEVASALHPAGGLWPKCSVIGHWSRLLSKDDVASLLCFKTYTGKIQYGSRKPGWSTVIDESFLGKDLVNTLHHLGKQHQQASVIPAVRNQRRYRIQPAARCWAATTFCACWTLTTLVSVTNAKFAEKHAIVAPRSWFKVKAGSR